MLRPCTCVGATHVQGTGLVRVANTGNPVTAITQMLKHQSVRASSAAALIAMYIGGPEQISVLMPIHGAESPFQNMADGQRNTGPFRPLKRRCHRGLIDTDRRRCLNRCWPGRDRRLATCSVGFFCRR